MTAILMLNAHRALNALKITVINRAAACLSKLKFMLVDQLQGSRSGRVRVMLTIRTHASCSHYGTLAAHCQPLSCSTDMLDVLAPGSGPLPASGYVYCIQHKPQTYVQAAQVRAVSWAARLSQKCRTFQLHMRGSHGNTLCLLV
jgi:hypothetical protein